MITVCSSTYVAYVAGEFSIIWYTMEPTYHDLRSISTFIIMCAKTNLPQNTVMTVLPKPKDFCSRKPWVLAPITVYTRFHMRECNCAKKIRVFHIVFPGIKHTLCLDTNTQIMFEIRQHGALTHCGIGMPYVVAAPSHYLNWCRLIIITAQWYSSQGNSTRSTNHRHSLEHNLSKI